MARLLARASQMPAPPRAVQTVFPLVVYAVFAVFWMGRGVVLHPATRVLGDPYRDKTILMWSFLWWPHAIAHGLDPFVASVVWAPHGVDLAWVTSSPTLSLAFAPVTETVGPIAAYNLAALVAPPLAAWTAFLLARRLTGSVPASLVAGFLFGFSPYVVGQSVGHLNLSFVCLVPLAGLLAVRFYQGDLGRRRFTALLTLVLALQFGISTEVFATLTLLAAICLVLALLLLGSRARLAELARYAALAYVFVGVLVSPYLVHAFGHPAPVRAHRPRHSLDLANVAFPTQTTWLQPPHGGVALTSGNVDGYAADVDEIGGYLGVPLLIVLVLAAVTLRGRVRRGVWVLLIAAVVADALALGPEMRVAGHPLAPGVWALVQRLPAIGEAIPIRLAMYSALFAALAAGLWLARWSGHRLWRFALAGLAVVSFLPTPSGAFWTSHVRQARFFATSAYRSVIRPGDRALVLPYGRHDSWSMLWQAETGFRFAMIGGHIGQQILPSECSWAGDWESLVAGTPPGGAPAFRRFLLAHHVTVVVEGPQTTAWERALIASSIPDVQPVRVADATILRIPLRLSRSLPRDAPPLPKGGKLRRRAANAVCRSATGS